MGSYWSREDFEEMLAPPTPPPQPKKEEPKENDNIEFIPTSVGYKTYLDALKGRCPMTVGKWRITKKEDEA